MRVMAKQANWDECPPNVSRFAKKDQTFLTAGRIYDVHAVAIFSGLPAFLIASDLRMPSWDASWLFHIVDRAMPNDWICNVFDEDPVILLGPEFIAKSHAAYADMVELAPEQVDRFWKRIEAISLMQVSTS